MMISIGNFFFFSTLTHQLTNIRVKFQIRSKQETYFLRNNAQ